MDESDKNWGCRSPWIQRDPVEPRAAGKRGICATCVERGQDFSPEPSVGLEVTQDTHVLSDTGHKGVTGTWSPQLLLHTEPSTEVSGRITGLERGKEKLQGTFNFYFFL